MITIFGVQTKVICSMMLFANKMNEDNITLVKEINKTNIDLNKRKIGIKRLPKNDNLTEKETPPEKSQEDKFLINLAEAVDLDEIELNHLNKLEYKEEIKKLTKNYTPRKTKSMELKMNIILTDDIPVNERPRRFPLSEQKIIDEQV